MSHKTDNETLVRTLAREGGRLKFSRLTYDGVLAANRLARANLVWIHKQAEG